MPDVGAEAVSEILNPLEVAALDAVRMCRTCHNRAALDGLPECAACHAYTRSAMSHKGSRMRKRHVPDALARARLDRRA